MAEPEHHPGASVDALLRRSGETTIRRSPAPGPDRAGVGAPRASLVVPLVAAVAFGLLALSLLVWGG